MQQQQNTRQNIQQQNTQQQNTRQQNIWQQNMQRRRKRSPLSVKKGYESADFKLYKLIILTWRAANIIISSSVHSISSSRMAHLACS